jgi:chromosome segregation ATPase
MTSVISEQLLEVNADFASTLDRLQAVLKNRALWSDGIEGCRGAVAMLTESGQTLKGLTDAALQIDTDLATARSEIKTWSANHADLCSVERQLREENDRQRAELLPLRTEEARLKKQLAGALATAKELRTECEQLRAARDEQGSALANARAIAKQLSEATSS